MAASSLVLSSSTTMPSLPHAGFSASATLETPFLEGLQLRFGASGFTILHSSVTDSGELYRAWEGFSVSLLAGKDLDLGALKGGFFFGGGLSVARYSGTSLLFAYPSFQTLFRIDIPSRSMFGFWVGIPAEVMVRNTGTVVSAGLAGGFRMGASGSRLSGNTGGSR